MYLWRPTGSNLIKRRALLSAECWQRASVVGPERVIDASDDVAAPPFYPVVRLRHLCGLSGWVALRARMPAFRLAVGFNGEPFRPAAPALEISGLTPVWKMASIDHVRHDARLSTSRPIEHQQLLRHEDVVSYSDGAASAAASNISCARITAPSHLLS